MELQIYIFQVCSFLISPYQFRSVWWFWLVCVPVWYPMLCGRVWDLVMLFLVYSNLSHLELATVCNGSFSNLVTGLLYNEWRRVWLCTQSLLLICISFGRGTNFATYEVVAIQVKLSMWIIDNKFNKDVSFYKLLTVWWELGLWSCYFVTFGQSSMIFSSSGAISCSCLNQTWLKIKTCWINLMWLWSCHIVMSGHSSMNSNSSGAINCICLIQTWLNFSPCWINLMIIVMLTFTRSSDWLIMAWTWVFLSGDGAGCLSALDSVVFMCIGSTLCNVYYLNAVLGNTPFSKVLDVCPYYCVLRMCPRRYKHSNLRICRLCYFLIKGNRYTWITGLQFNGGVMHFTDVGWFVGKVRTGFIKNSTKDRVISAGDNSGLTIEINQELLSGIMVIFTWIWCVYKSWLCKMYINTVQFRPINGECGGTFQYPTKAHSRQSMAYHGKDPSWWIRWNDYMFPVETILRIAVIGKCSCTVMFYGRPTTYMITWTTLLCLLLPWLSGTSHWTAPLARQAQIVGIHEIAAERHLENFQLLALLMQLRCIVVNLVVFNCYQFMLHSQYFFGECGDMITYATKAFFRQSMVIHGKTPLWWLTKTGSWIMCWLIFGLTTLGVLRRSGLHRLMVVYQPYSDWVILLLIK